MHSPFGFVKKTLKSCFSSYTIFNSYILYSDNFNSHTFCYSYSFHLCTSFYLYTFHLYTCNSNTFFHSYTLFHLHHIIFSDFHLYILTRILLIRIPFFIRILFICIFFIRKHLGLNHF